jgi:hypothetical protein
MLSRLGKRRHTLDHDFLQRKLTNKTAITEAAAMAVVPGPDAPPALPLILSVRITSNSQRSLTGRNKV